MSQNALAVEFRRYAAEARHMNEFARSAEAKQHWNALAERWVRCAERADAEAEAEAGSEKPATRRRKLDPVKKKRAAACAKAQGRPSAAR
jgi:hypothetical protein